MKPAPFEYHSPTTVGEAAGLLHELGGDAKILSGGQSLIPMLALRLASFEHLVDISGIASLQSIDEGEDCVRIGATVRDYRIEDSSMIAERVPLLAQATPLIGHFQIRNRGTVGGSIAHADPAAEYPAVALALDATLDIAGPRRSRSVPAADFFQGMWTTSVEDGELLTAITFPVWGPHSGFAVEEVARRHGDFAIAGAACGVQLDGGTIVKAAIALFGMDQVPRRATTAEAALVGAAAADVDITAVGLAAMEGLSPADDLHASAGLRLRIGATVVRRALTRAIEEAGR